LEFLRVRAGGVGPGAVFRDGMPLTLTPPPEAVAAVETGGVALPVGVEEPGRLSRIDECGEVPLEKLMLA